MKEELSRIIINGGVLSPGELKYICETAESLGLDAISFGSRQDIIFPKKITDLEKLKTFDKIQIVKPGELKTENIVSSYVSTDIFTSTSWLTSARYLYVLEQFKHNLKLRVNITDPKQRLVPLFTGDLNFIASEHEDYWYLYVKLPGWKKMQMYPALIYSWDLDKIELAVEGILKEEPETIETLFELVSDAISTNNRTVDKQLEVPFYPFPYYEGMNRIGDKYWLGLYWRNNNYDVSFLKAMCELCAENKIGKISITPWKSFIVKGIPIQSKIQWEKFLGQYGINVRHSMLELNWHLPVNDKEALSLKKYLVSNFDQNDISTYGLTFGITNYENNINHFTSIVIEKNKQPESLGDFVIRDTYNLLYARNFDPNTRDYIMHVQDIDKVELPGLLMELSQLYFEQLGIEREDDTQQEVKKETIEEKVFQCKDCLTIYNEAFGDITQGVEPNTSFESLSDTYECSLCEAPKSNFQKKVLVK
ncbi:Rubredoxin [Flaviramulus basaltis]|uniref:Rubredoxin n=1 Tax=Flaviramulus basaltis TaxID=369401 RepID=A0A1K2IPM7_9FLAO|nr:rubredoxin domain-containing protein [Flaviramulus basaltis]SFZ93651.1 Rubredoxin [Flaviramulus basaltis]